MNDNLIKLKYKLEIDTETPINSLVKITINPDNEIDYRAPSFLGIITEVNSDYIIVQRVNSNQKMNITPNDIDKNNVKVAFINDSNIF